VAIMLQKFTNIFLMGALKSTLEFFTNFSQQINKLRIHSVGCCIKVFTFNATAI